MKPNLKPPETKCLKLKIDKLFSTFAFKFNLRHYNKVPGDQNNVGVLDTISVGRCRLIVSKPELKARLVSVIRA